VCVRESQREIVCMCVRERASEKLCVCVIVRVCVCIFHGVPAIGGLRVCVCAERERKRDSVRVYECVRVPSSACNRWCLCVCGRERERERERVCISI